MDAERRVTIAAPGCRPLQLVDEAQQELGIVAGRDGSMEQLIQIGDVLGNNRIIERVHKVISLPILTMSHPPFPCVGWGAVYAQVIA